MSAYSLVVHHVQRMATGKCVFELRPALEWDKGKAVEYLMQQLGVDDPAQVMQRSFTTCTAVVGCGC